jgi:hypothetical protein
MACAPEVMERKEIETCKIAVSTELTEPTSAAPTRVSSGGHGFSNMRAIQTGPMQDLWESSSHIEDRNPVRRNLSRCGSSD